MSNRYEYNEKQRKRKENVKLAIFSIIFFGILLGFFVPTVVYKTSGPVKFYTDVLGRMNSPTLSGTVYLKNVPVYLERDTSLTQYDLDKWTEEVPDVLLQYCSEIYICNFDDPNSVCYQFTSENKSESSGFVIWDNSGRIFIDINSYNKLDTIIHELMHRYDEVYGINNTQQVKDLFNTKSSYLVSETKDNAQKDESEFLSEAAVLYFTHPEDLKTTELQPVYDYFQSLFHYYA